MVIYIKYRVFIRVIVFNSIGKVDNKFFIFVIIKRIVIKCFSIKLFIVVIILLLVIFVFIV